MYQNIIRLLPLLLGTTVFAQDALKLHNSASIIIEPGAELTVLGNTRLANGSRVTNNGTITFTGAAGATAVTDFYDSTLTGYSYGTGKMVFSSPGGHRIVSKNAFPRVDINTPVLTLASNLTADHWHLQSGQVVTGPYLAIVAGTATNDLEAGTGNSNFANSWINGNLRRYIDPATNDRYSFALGNTTRHLASMESMRAAPIADVDYIDASFTDKPGTDAGLAVTENGLQYVAVNNGGVWHFVPNRIPGTGKFNIHLSTEGLTGLADNQFAIMQRADQSATGSDWTIPAGSSINPPGGLGRMVTDGYALRNNVSTFGQFGIGQTSAALPVTMTGFSAKRLSSVQVQLDWQTQAESNNKGFGIERRTDNEATFTVAGFINSKALNGNSTSTINYGFTDNNDYAGVLYYRLRQTDLDDRGFYSLVKAVSGSASNVSVLLWPNPGKGQFSVKITGNTGKKEILISDLQGRLIRRLIVTGNQQTNVDGLISGTYVITIPDALGKDANFNEKIVVFK